MAGPELTGAAHHRYRTIFESKVASIIIATDRVGLVAAIPSGGSNDHAHYGPGPKTGRSRRQTRDPRGAGGRARTEQAMTATSGIPGQVFTSVRDALEDSLAAANLRLRSELLVALRETS